MQMVLSWYAGGGEDNKAKQWEEKGCKSVIRKEIYKLDLHTHTHKLTDCTVRILVTPWMGGFVLLEGKQLNLCI